MIGPPRRDYIIPDSLDKDVSLRISQALKPKTKWFLMKILQI